MKAHTETSDRFFNTKPSSSVKNSMLANYVVTLDNKNKLAHFGSKISPNRTAILRQIANPLVFLCLARMGNFKTIDKLTSYHNLTKISQERKNSASAEIRTRRLPTSCAQP